MIFATTLRGMTDKSFQPTLAGLRAFVAVAAKQHFGSAATTLNVSQSTLSQALAALEAGLDARLVERSTRRVRVTTEGMELLPFAQAVVEAAYAFTAAVAGASDPLQGTLRLGEGALAAALMALPADARGITEVPIYEEDFLLAVPPGHPLSGKHRVPTAVLAQLPLLLLDEGHCLRDQALEVCQNAGVRPELADTRAASLATAVQCVSGGLGVTLIPQSAVPVEAARSALGLARFAAPRPGRRIGLVFRSSSGRDESYGRLAGIIGELVGGEQQVRMVG